MLSRIVTCKNFQLLICSPVKMKSLHLLWKFRADIFQEKNEVSGNIFKEKNEFENCHLKYSVLTLIRITFIWQQL